MKSIYILEGLLHMIMILYSSITSGGQVVRADGPALAGGALGPAGDVGGGTVAAHQLLLVAGRGSPPWPAPRRSPGRLAAVSAGGGGVVSAVRPLTSLLDHGAAVGTHWLGAVITPGATAGWTSSATTTAASSLG